MKVSSLCTKEDQNKTVMEEYPNWLEMPHELMTNILQRLRTAEILTSAQKVCTAWRTICKDPMMWQVIDMQNLFDDWDGHYDLQTLTKQAVNLSHGELIDVSIKYFGTDDLLHHIVQHSSKLKRLSLWCCYDITGSGLSRAVKRCMERIKDFQHNSTQNYDDSDDVSSSGSDGGESSEEDDSDYYDWV
ncbi:hypothetical protein L2E82_39757 [Cichorium intybus]|uniref:Uncharacterized protein n=1 Tax=Cichorium intybus TaxID=13427 RepID=A0ACB9AIW3_CICIN|nr:hypothetical protein L2E82_39757 [Cichorium intybus]